MAKAVWRTSRTAMGAVTVNMNLHRMIRRRMATTVFLAAPGDALHVATATWSVISVGAGCHLGQSKSPDDVMSRDTDSDSHCAGGHTLRGDNHMERGFRCNVNTDCQQGRNQNNDTSVSSHQQASDTVERVAKI